MLSPMTTETGSMVIAIVRDVTAPKLATESVRKTNEELLALVAELQRRDSEMQALISTEDLLQSCTIQEEAYKVVGLAAGELFDGQAGCLAVLHESDAYRATDARWGDRPLGEQIFA